MKALGPFRGRNAITGLLVAGTLAGMLLGAFIAALGPIDDPGEKARASTDVIEVPTLIEELMATMSLREKVGQMVMAGIEGTRPGEDARTLIVEHRIGGVILFARNIETPDQVGRLTNELQAMAVQQAGGLPLLIAVDQEGGQVIRIQHATHLPGAMAFGAAADPDLAYRAARQVARELRAMGINLNFAPVMDVNNNPKNPVIGIRSFGEDPGLVARLGAATIRGYQDGGVLATAKHFPGHGDTDVDSHIALPTVPHDRERLDAVELFPFRAAIEAGVGVIMSAHVTFPAIDPTPGLPATLSRPVLTGLLREELGFEGLIFTDAMEMGAIVNTYGIKEAAVMAVQAGADVVLVGWPKDWRMALEAVTALEEAALSGKIAPERIDASVRRILAAKERLGLLPGRGVGATAVSAGSAGASPEEALVEAVATPPQVDTAQIRELVGGPDGEALALEAARRSVTVVQDRDGLLPLSGHVLLLVPQVRGLTGAENPDGARRPGGPETPLGSFIAREGLQVDERTYPLNPSATERSWIITQARSADAVVLATYNAWQNQHAGQASLAHELVDAGARLVVVALRDPYDLSQMSDVSTYIALYGITPAQLQAAAEILSGRTTAVGRLPVSIPGIQP